jgi:hypothetical protein
LPQLTWASGAGTTSEDGRVRKVARKATLDRLGVEDCDHVPPGERPADVPTDQAGAADDQDPSFHVP